VTLAPNPTTRIQLCGALVIERNGERLESRLPGRQGRVLFVYLAFNRHRPVTREELAESLWPGQPPAATGAALNALISKLRRVLGADAVPGRSTIQLRLDHAWVDSEAAAEAIHRAESALALGDWARAWGPSQVALFVAERVLLPGEDAPWIDVRRRQLAELRLRALECYAAAGLNLAGTELSAAVRASRELINLAPLRESGHRCLMQALARQGNVAEALRVYSRLCDLLRDELGVSPSPPTRAVYDELVLA
jgi:pentatricopeptide repeat protein